MSPNVPITSLGAVEVVSSVAPISPSLGQQCARRRHARPDAYCDRARDRGPAWPGARLQLLGEQEGEFQRLLGVEPRIAVRLVAAAEVGLGQPVRAADALRHFLAGHLDMHAAGIGALGAACTSKKRCTSRRIASKLRVLQPCAAVTCCRAWDRTTTPPCARPASPRARSGGSFWRRPCRRPCG